MARHLGRYVAATAALALVVHAQPPSQSPDNPMHGIVRLPAQHGWNAQLVYRGDVGVWAVQPLQVFPELGCPEIVALDDKGRCTVLVSYSGKWTPSHTVNDGQWLAPVAQGDVDPGHPGAELYVSGKAGNVYQVRSLPKRRLESREVAYFTDDEVHTLVAANLLPQRAGDELLAFTVVGGVYVLRSEDSDAFTVERVGTVPGRVRDAVTLHAPPGETPVIATVSRAGEVALLRLTPNGGFKREVVVREPMGFGRIARKPGATDAPIVLYVTRDDGLILRLARGREGEWQREVVYAGPQGPRGVVAGRFYEDPEREAIAVFGYSSVVQILSRVGVEPWRVESVFTDSDRGHWLAVAELDGRNDTDEIIGSGYAGRVFLLSRPPGYGLPGSTASGLPFELEANACTCTQQPTGNLTPL